MDPLMPSALEGLDDEQLDRLIADHERRQPPATIPGVGIRPDRRPWTYRDIWRLRAALAERALRRGQAKNHG